MGLPQICWGSPTGPTAQPGLEGCWPRGGRAGEGAWASQGLGFCFCPLLLTAELFLPSCGEGLRSAFCTEQRFKTEGQSLEERKHVRGGFGWDLNNRCHSAAGFITLAHFRRADLNSMQHADWLFALIPLMLPLILPREASPPPVHLSPFRHSDVCCQLPVPEARFGQSCLSGADLCLSSPFLPH